MELGCVEDVGYNAGDRSEGMTSRCMECGGVEDSCLRTFSSIAGNGEGGAVDAEDRGFGRGIGM